MKSKIEMTHYYNEKLIQLETIVKAQRWSCIKEKDILKWLTQNFENDIEGKYYILKILLHTLYYTHENIIELLRFGLYDKIYGEIIKKELISSGSIDISMNTAELKVKDLRRKSLFIPLLDSNKPSKSGNEIITHLVHKLDINENQTDFHFNITLDILSNYKYLIIVDDCIGSGNQLKAFWNSEAMRRIRLDCRNLKIMVYYLVLVGYRNSIQKLLSRTGIEEINIIVCDVLTDRNRIFSSENIVWEKCYEEKDKKLSSDERDCAIEYFKGLQRHNGISFLGYRKLDFAVVLENRIPNWTTPIFWRANSNWEFLIKRKASNE